jgi:hypothetical protein
MPYVGRREDQSIYGLWSVRQWDGQEFLAENHADVVAARQADQPPTPTPEQRLASLGLSVDDLKELLGLQ